MTRKMISDDEAPLMNERIMNETGDFYRAIRNVADDKRVYVDESFAYDNEAAIWDARLEGIAYCEVESGTEIDGRFIWLLDKMV